MSASTQEIGGCSKIFENSKIGMPRHLDSSTTTQNGQNHGQVQKTQSILLSEICTGILWQDCFGKGNLRKSYCNTVGRRFPIRTAYSYTVKKGYSFLCMWMTSNWLERNKSLIRCGKNSTKKSIWESKDIGDNYRTTFELRISSGGAEKISCSENLRISLWSYDMEGHAKKCVKRYCELANRTTQQLYKVCTPCIDDHHFKEAESKFV